MTRAPTAPQGPKPPPPPAPPRRSGSSAQSELSRLTNQVLALERRVANQAETIAIMRVDVITWRDAYEALCTGDAAWDLAPAEFPRRLRGLRESRGLTQREVGEAIGTSAAAVTLWESGKAMPRWPALERLCRFFSVRASSLIGKR